jgi:hypothetical protein
MLLATYHCVLYVDKASVVAPFAASQTISRCGTLFGEGPFEKAKYHSYALFCLYRIFFMRINDFLLIDRFTTTFPYVHYEQLLYSSIC